MKRKINSFKRTGIASMALCVATCAAFGQDPGNGPDGNRRPPLPPVIQALDTNHDGIIEADEIANAAQSLKTLLKSGTDQLTIPELLGPPRHGPRPQRQGQGQWQAQGNGSDMQLANPGAQNGPTPQNGPGSNQDGPPGPPPGPPPGRHHPPSPLMQALDTNHDGILEADEIANAAQSLKKLDKNGDGQVTLDELRPPPPPNWQAPPDPTQGGTNGQTDAAPQPPPPPPPPQ